MLFHKKNTNKSEKSQKNRGTGFKGYCVCPQCNYNIIHQRGTPCTTIQCPVC